MANATDILRGLYRRSRDLRRGYRESRLHLQLIHDPSGPDLLLSPHFDDAVLDCWSVLSGERRLEVRNVFAGVPSRSRPTPWDAITGARDSAARTRERIAEDALALARAGRTPVNLPLLDAQYRARPSALEVADLDRALAATLDGASRIYVPAAIGGHPDHQLARRYARMLLRAGFPVTLYADLPYCVLHGWPAWVDGREPDPYRNVDAFWMTFLQDVPEMPPLRSANVKRLDDAAASAKLEAMRCYRTQFPSLSYGARDLLADPEIHRFEVFWELGPASPAS